MGQNTKMKTSEKKKLLENAHQMFSCRHKNRHLQYVGRFFGFTGGVETLRTAD